MRSTNVIFYATRAVFNKSTFLHCSGGLHASIPAIETGLLPVNEGNIPSEDDDQPPELAPVEGDLVWRPTVSWPYMPPADGDDHQPPPITPPLDQGDRQNPNSRGLSSSSSSSNRGSVYQREQEFWNTPDGVHTPSDTRGKGAISWGSAQTPEEDWQPLSNRDAPTGHWEYDFSHIPYSHIPEGPAFIRQPLENEHQWIGDSSLSRHERPDQLWSLPDKGLKTFGVLLLNGEICSQECLLD